MLADAVASSPEEVDAVGVRGGPSGVDDSVPVVEEVVAEAGEDLSASGFLPRFDRLRPLVAL
ncbi:hypothetical protein EBO15_01700 [Actinomadura harenae]|uniref:Uncharacterized protein n=1 Tax=Actinomadura harenae TaxID=2483351 RepID=A0A3M2MDM8_9ACTN|nr:hypothetical protein EBO15_01700 [Actinomadura harenae]